jgi:hypothetical protein
VIPRVRLAAVGALAFALAAPTVYAAEHGPTEFGNVSVTDLNTEGFPIFDVSCRGQQCLDHHGHLLGSEQEIARRIPVIPRQAVYDNRYPCHYLCWDHRGNVIGSAPID